MDNCECGRYPCQECGRCECLSTDWIDVKCRLPDKDQRVLTYGTVRLKNEDESTKEVRSCEYETWDYTHCDGKKDSQFAFLQSGCGCCDTSMIDVTHWMPLPEPPK